MYRPSQTPRLTLSSKRITGFLLVAHVCIVRNPSFNSINKLRLTNTVRTRVNKDLAQPERDLTGYWPATNVPKSDRRVERRRVSTLPQHSPLNRVSKETMKVEVFHFRQRARRQRHLPLILHLSCLFTKSD